MSSLRATCSGQTLYHWAIAIEAGSSSVGFSSPPMSDSAPSLVEFKHVTFAYPGATGDRVILNDVTLSVPRGKVTALMGASGGGKTTVLRLIGGEQKAGSGEVLF